MFGLSKGTIAGIIAAIVAGLLALVYFLYQSNIHKAEDIGKKDVIISSQDDTIKKDKKSDDVTEKIDADVAQKNEKVADDASTVITKARDKVDVVKEKYQELPKSPDNDQAKSKELALIAINKMWEQYCSNGNTDPDCTAFNQGK